VAALVLDWLDVAELALHPESLLDNIIGVVEDQPHHTIWIVINYIVDHVVGYLVLQLGLMVSLFLSVGRLFRLPTLPIKCREISWLFLF